MAEASCLPPSSSSPSPPSLCVTALNQCDSGAASSVTFGLGESLREGAPQGLVAESLRPPWRPSVLGQSVLPKPLLLRKLLLICSIFCIKQLSCKQCCW